MRSAILSVTALFILLTPKQGAAFPDLRLPYPASETWQISTGYGGSVTHQGRDHNALDFNIPGSGDCGKPVPAPAEGRVSRVNTDGWGGGYGNFVDIDHGGGYTSRITHLESVSVTVNQSVQQGHVVGTVGTTGQSSGCHIHYVLYLNGTSIVPEPMSGYSSFEEDRWYTSDNVVRNQQPVWDHIADGVIALAPGQVVTNFIGVGPHMQDIEVEIIDLSTDLDLYVWQYPAIFPSWNRWSCRPFAGGTTSERCTFTNTSPFLLIYAIHAPRGPGSCRVNVKTRFR